jgi:Cupin-like domain
MKPVDQIECEKQFSSEYIEAGIPGVLVRGAARWPALSRWTTTYLSDLIGDKIVDVSMSADGKFDYANSLGASLSRERLPFCDVIANITSRSAFEPALYIMQRSIAVDLPELAPDIQVPAAIENARASPFFWLGSAGNVTPVHYDGVNNLFAQVRGRKRFILYHPAQSEALYADSTSTSFSHVGGVDVENPDFQRFPKFGEAEPLECELHPSDLLFLPAYYWHHVRSLDFAISVNFWWAPHFDQCLVPPCLRQLRTAYAYDRLATVGAPISNYRDGFIGAARRAMHLGHMEFAALLAGGALDRLLRDGRLPSSMEVKPWLATADAAAAGAPVSGADVQRMIEGIEQCIPCAGSTAMEAGSAR